MSFTKRKSVILNKGKKGGKYFLNLKYKNLLPGSNIVNFNDDDMDVNYDDSDCVAF